MLVANSKDNTSIQIKAWEATREEGPFYCPACRQEVILHKGSVRVHHFAHKANSQCSYGAGETDLHRRAKMELYQALSMRSGLTCRLEAPLAGVRADVLIQSIRTKKAYAIEVQISQLTMDLIIERTRRYAKQGVYVLWVFEWSNDLLSARYAPSLKERWAHALNFGWVYYWRNGEEVTPVKFDKAKLYRPAAEWYDVDAGEEQSVGGYEYTSKRYRVPVISDNLLIGRDFQGVDRSAWKGCDIVIPACRILTAKGL